VGNVVSGVGVAMQSQADAAAADFAARAARKDADAARLQATVQADLIHEAWQERRGTSIAVAAAQGSRAYEGSPLQNLMQLASSFRRAELRTKYAGEVAFAKYATESKLLKQKARNIRTVGMISAIATSLSGTPVNYGGAPGRDPSGEMQTQAFKDYRAGERQDYSGLGSGDFGSAGEGL
jgi:hypothetical protein